MTSAREQQSWRRGRKNSTARCAVEFLGGGTPQGYHHATSHTDRQTDRQTDGRSERNERTRERENKRKLTAAKTTGTSSRRERETPSQLGNPESTSFPTPTTPAPPHIDRDNHRPPNHAPGTPHHRPFPTMNRSPSNVLQPNSRRFLRLRPRHRVNTPNYVPFNREGMYSWTETTRDKALWQGGLVSAHFSLSQVIASQTDDRFFDDHDRTLHLRSILLMILPCD